MKGVTARYSSGAVYTAAQHGVAVFLSDMSMKIVTNFCTVCSGDCIIAFAGCCCEYTTFISTYRMLSS